MLIHKRDNYAIEVERTADGTLRAVKTGADGSRREGKFYPERDCSALVGETDEYMAWQIIRDVAAQLGEGCTVPVAPSHIMIAGAGCFELCEWSRGMDARFCAPEGYEPVWALGATIFYLMLGCPVFQGGGGVYQHAATPVPLMRRNAPELSTLVGKCLSFKPSERPSVKELKAEATAVLKRMESAPASRPLRRVQNVGQYRSRDSKSLLDLMWPDEID